MIGLLLSNSNECVGCGGTNSSSINATWILAWNCGDVNAPHAMGQICGGYEDAQGLNVESVVVG